MLVTQISRPCERGFALLAVDGRIKAFFLLGNFRAC